MFMINPFAELSASIPPNVMQGYLILMVLLVVGGTILDMIHKKKREVLFRKCGKSEEERKAFCKCWRKYGACRFYGCERSVDLFRVL